MTPEQKQTATGFLDYATRLAKRLTPDPDAPGEAALALCKAVVRYDPARGPLKPWVRLWVRRAILRTLTARKTARPPSAPSQEVWSVERDFLDSLPGQLRRIAELKIAGHSPPAIAEQVGLSLSTVKRRIKELQERLGEYLARDNGR